MSGSRDHGAKLVRTTQTIRREIDAWTLTHTCTPPSQGSRQAADRAVAALQRLIDEARGALLTLEGEISAADEAAAERVEHARAQGALDSSG